MKEIFDTYIENAFGDFKQAKFKFKQFEKNYRDFFPSNKNATLLDIGVGRGEMLSSMKMWGYGNYVGIDISPSTIKFCQSLGLNCTLVQDTQLWLDDKKECIDMVTLIDVLEHIEKKDTISLLKHINSSLQEGGTLIVQTPNLQSPDGQLHRYNDFTHEVGFIGHSLTQVLTVAGFKDINIYGFEDSVDNTCKEITRRFLRSFYWKVVRFFRKLNGNMDPPILHPTFYAVAKKK